jgi:isopentenyl-diphosphate delta-isomerase
MGMGLGSCRQLLFSDEYLPDFDIRDILGPDLPLYANLGIAQLEQLIRDKETDRIEALVVKLRADGLIVHVNPLQEAMQPEGDKFRVPPLETISALLELYGHHIIVKEVGQGMGPESLRALMQLPIDAIEFAAAGGTNFAKLELLRKSEEARMLFEKIAAVGHSATEMVHFSRQITDELGEKCLVKQLIISGGIQNFLDGYYLVRTSPLPAVYGQASGFLKHAQQDYTTLRDFISTQVRGLELAYAFLKVR